MIVAVAGPKGGAGKTLVATSLALSISRCVYLDCDVEEPNGHIYLRPNYRKQRRVTIPVPRPKNWGSIDLKAAADFCPYNALFFARGKLMVFRELCTGCGGCFAAVSAGSLPAEDYPVGAVKEGSGRNGVEVVTGELSVGGQRTARVVTAVKDSVDPARDTVIDCPPGTARPMLEAVRGSHYCLVVTEDSPFGLEDLKAGVRALGLMGIRSGVVLNRARGGRGGIGEFCAEEGIPVVMEIPLSRDIAASSSRGRSLPDVSDSWTGEFRLLWDRIGRNRGG